MTTIDEQKNKLKQLLNEGLTLRLKLKTVNPTSSIIKEPLDRLQDIAQQCLKLSEVTQMDHGKAHAMEFNCFVQWTRIVIEESSKQTTSIQSLIDKTDSIESQLLECRKLALGFGDKVLVSRVLELLVNIYNKTNQLDKEIETIEKAVDADKSVPKVVVLLDALFRKLEFVYQDRDRIYQLNINKDPNAPPPQPDQQQDDGFMKLHIDTWEHYLWLKDQPSFPRDQYIVQKKAQLFKLSIYVGSLANPLISLKDPEVLKIANEAFDEAFYIANLIQDKEYFCAATAHKSSVSYRTLPQPERERLLQSLKDIESQMKPKNSEIRDLIDSIENKAPSLHPEEKEKDPPPKSS
ncbi:hypothetical protein CYY_008325 [Polysphondylium violaceum]|uniref:Uncharacterized protein n=1 Tax=Polysphondylium violaceum TaxID=133409 RepID=A0A8J4PQK1_9MYCE|nr:hypothetical protein CYY_008325 [Polysphondylium violaceum]